jgi:hypothetical protein
MILYRGKVVRVQTFDLLVEAASPETARANLFEMAKHIEPHTADGTPAGHYDIQVTPYVQNTETPKTENVATVEEGMLTQEDRIRAASERGVIENDNQAVHDQSYIAWVEQAFAPETSVEKESEGK